jgi:hypothetical protein
MKNYQTILATLSLGSLLATGTAHASPSVCESSLSPAVVLQGSVFNVFNLNASDNDPGFIEHWWLGNGGLNVELLGGESFYPPAAASWDANNMDLFVIGTDKAVWNRHNCTADCVGITGWGPWVSLGGDSISAPTAWSSAPGILDVFVVGTDENLWNDHWDSTVGAWTGWTFYLAFSGDAD